MKRCPSCQTTHDSQEWHCPACGSVLEREQNDNNQKTWYVRSNFTLKYDILKGLTYTGQFAYDYNSTLEETYSSQKNWTGMDTDGTRTFCFVDVPIAVRKFLQVAVKV